MKKIPTKTLSLEIPPPSTPPTIFQDESVKNALTAIGFDEVISQPFVRQENLPLNKPLDIRGAAKPIEIINPPSPDIKTMRLSLFPNLLDFVKKVENERGTEARFFEIGKIYWKGTNNQYFEKRKLGIIYWQKNKRKYLNFKGYLEAFFKKISLPETEFSNIDNDVFRQLALESFIDGGKFLIGGLYDDTYFIQIDLDSLLGKTSRQVARLWPKFPPTIEDMSFKTKPKTEIGPLIKSVKEVSAQIFSVKLIDCYQNSATIRITYRNPKKTMDDTEVKKIREKIVETLREKFQVELRGK